MKTIKDYISKAEQLINEYNVYNAKRNAFYDENIGARELNVEVYLSLQKWCKMIDEENIIIRKAVNAVKDCFRLFGVQLPKKIDEYNMDDHLRKFKWMADDIDKRIEQYYRF